LEASKAPATNMYAECVARAESSSVDIATLP